MAATFLLFFPDSVSANKCRHHTSGCSLELSAGRQTKIELLSPPSKAASSCSKVPAAASTYPAPASNSPVFRVEGTARRDTCFVPRRCTPLSLLFSPSGSWDESFSLSGGDTVDDNGRAVDIGVPPYTGGEADFVGCVFAVTRQCSSTSMPGEVLITADSTESSSDSTGIPTVDGGHQESGEELRKNLKVGSSIEGGSETGGNAAAELVTYRVYFTEPSGACMCLERKILPELSRHHRILRSVPGSCWAIVNGEPCDRFAPGTTCSLGIGTRHASPGRGVRTGDADSFAISIHERHSRGFAVVRWSSTTAVGGRGGSSPPRTLAGSPAGHLGQPLLALTRWSKGVEGTNAVRRERERLTVLLARDKRAQTDNVRCEDSCGSGVRNEYPKLISTPHRAPSSGRENTGNACSVIGYISSFQPQSSFLEDGLLGVQVDDGEGVRVLQLSRLVLEQLLRKSLGGNSSRRCLSGQRVTAMASENAESADSSCGQSRVSPNLPGDVVIRAQALLERVTVPNLSAQPDTIYTPVVTQAGRDPTTDPESNRVPQPVSTAGEINQVQSAMGSVGPQVDALALSPDQAIDELVGAVFQVAHKSRNLSFGQSVARDADPEPFSAAGTVLREGTKTKVDVPVKKNASFALKSPSSNGLGIALTKFLSDLAVLCGRRQHVFAVAEASYQTKLVGLTSVVGRVGEVDAARSAAQLLEDLSDRL